MTPPTDEDLKWLAYAIELSRNCTNTERFFVGAVLVDANANNVGQGYTEEAGRFLHAEEIALQLAIENGASLDQATLYSSLEPCRSRASSRLSCVDLVLDTPIKRVVYALDEPPIFVPGKGAQALLDHGIEVHRIDSLAPAVREINSHLISQ